MKKTGWILLILMASCTQRNAEEQLKSFVDDPDNKITQRITVGKTGVVVKFLPTSYRSLIGQTSFTGDDKDRFYHFDVTFNSNTNEKPAKEKLLYLDFDMQKDFVLLVNDKDSVGPAICQKIENGIAGCYEYQVVFEKNGNERWDEFTLLYNDKIFGTGTTAFVYKENDIQKIPGLKSEVSK
jgi:hypothetical protein